MSEPRDMAAAGTALPPRAESAGRTASSPGKAVSRLIAAAPPAGARAYFAPIQQRARALRTAPRHSVRLRQRRPVLSMSLNLTPMIDIVFNLLFFFMVGARFHSPEGMLPAQLPGLAAAAVDVPRTPIRVRFVPDPGRPDVCQITIDRFQEAPQTIETLGMALRSIRDGQPGFGPGTPVHLLASDDVRWDHVVNAYNAALSARYEKVYFAESP